jgi:hypothetical protein
MSASTAAGEPRKSASTAPSDRLRTQPETFNLSAREARELAIAHALDGAFDEDAANGHEFVWHGPGTVEARRTCGPSPLARHELGGAHEA